MKKTVAKWENRVSDKETPWTENEIIYFRKFVGSSGCKDEITRKRLINLLDKTSDLVGYNITPEQTQKGINYIKNVAFKKSGEPRNSKQNVFGQFEQRVIKNFYCFKFVGLCNIANNGYAFYVPIYRVLAHDGSWFEYTTNMGRMEVVNVSPRLRLVVG